MTNWLQKILTPPAVQARKTGNLTVKTGGSLPAQPLQRPAQPVKGLPNATVIYGIGASFLFVSSFFLLIGGRLLPGFTIFLLGCCLTGFALHLLKHQD